MGARQLRNLQVHMVNCQPLADPCGNRSGDNVWVGAKFTVRVENDSNTDTVNVAEGKAIIRMAEALCNEGVGKILCRNVSLPPGGSQEYSDRHGAEVPLHLYKETGAALEIAFAWSGAASPSPQTIAIQRQL